MRKILPGSILSYNQYGYLKVAKTIKSKCPKCGKSGEFTLKANFYQVRKTGVFAEGHCSECKKPSVFVIMINDYSDQKNQEQEAEVYIYDPSASRNRLDQIEQNKNMPRDLIRSYRSALNVSQSKDNSATAVMSKRVLESVLKNYLGETIKDKSLSQQFDQLPKHIDLTTPIQSLSHLVHPDSPFYEMLELEREIDDETAVLLMKLLEGLIEYLFVLPEVIRSVQDEIEKKLN
ncbi:hypothetical protein [Pseudalkalibacillus decolorationis]|uniref:hypothetical protein n=1 Tax=Pseudalkalibacillus decolorationis TaxID=163879 RepID=UPI002147536F|nr:hypothetical protein [Pseudalkalibacillus decolorationis]